MKVNFLPSLFLLLSFFTSFAVIAQISPQNKAEEITVDKNSDSESNNVFQFANQCYSLRIAGNHLPENSSNLVKQEPGYRFTQNSENIASKFYMRPTAIGSYLLYDQDKHYLTANRQKLEIAKTLVSEMTLDMPEKDYLQNNAEWELESTRFENQFHLKHIQSQTWLSLQGTSTDKTLAIALTLIPTTGCANFPEANIASSGKILKTQHEDGTLFGFIDAHEHIGANHGFGGKVFHGASFHKFGIEHALADCEKHHGENGSKDLMNIAYKGGSGKISAKSLLSSLFAHLVNDKPDHVTSGYPELTDWNVNKTATHQSLYYKWIERAYLGGMRMMVEYMESTEVVCEAYKDLLPSQSQSETCNEMAHVDHQLIKIKELQDYIDAQHGGPGKGWFRLVYSPEEARDVIKAGKLAVILGIEIENPFNCFVNARDGFEPCNDQMVRERLNAYYDKGVRALFPSHKFVSAYSSGDGNPGILEIGDYLNTGQWRNYVDCKDVPGEFSMQSHGEGELRSIFSKLADVPGIHTLNKILSGENAGTPKQVLPLYPKAEAHCQRNGFTPLGFTLIDEMMRLGMIIDLGHTPKPAVNDIIPVLKSNDYPAVHTHGGDQAAIKYLNGLSTRGLGDTCRDEQGNSEILKKFNTILANTNPESGMPLNGLSYDFNGFASYAKPRFGEFSKCTTKQNDKLEYPFTSFGGDIVFEKLQTGDKVFDFNEEGLANIGLFPDLIEEARRGGASEAEINALFKTAEAYIRIWEKAEQISKFKKGNNLENN